MIGGSIHTLMSIIFVCRQPVSDDFRASFERMQEVIISLNMSHIEFEYLRLDSNPRRWMELRVTNQNDQRKLRCWKDSFYGMRVAISDTFVEVSQTIDASQLQVENLENELRVFFGSFDRGLEALKSYEVRRNTFKFLDQYGTIADILKTGKCLLLSGSVRGQTCCAVCRLNLIRETFIHSLTH